MDFRLVTETLLKELENEGVAYAVIGGFALGLWGATRATIDLGFLLLLNDLPKAESILAKYSFRRAFKSDNVAQYVSDLAPYGQIDVLLAFRSISLSMLKRSVSRPIAGTDATIRTLQPEDLIGLKVQAVANDPARRLKDAADIEALLAACRFAGKEVDWPLLEDYFELFGEAAWAQDLKDRHG